MTKVNRLHIRYEPRVGTKSGRRQQHPSSGLHEVRHVDNVVEFIFINEIYVRFSSVEGVIFIAKDWSSLEIFNVYPHVPYDDDLRIHDISMLELKADSRFARVIDNLFRRECIDDNNIHEYVFRIFRRPTYGRTDIPAYWDINVREHNIDLPRYAHSPTPSEMYAGDFNNTWTDEQRAVVREFRAYAISFPRTLTENQFVEFYMQRIKDSPSRADAHRIWRQREELGLL